MKPSLLILAAGMGSRYGSMKQIEGFGPSGETITDYSIFDAIRAGFGKIVFVISPKMEEEFVSSYIKKFPSDLVIDYVIQGVNTIPGGIEISKDRVKPWGTAHAVLMAKKKIKEPFAVINADDFYGRSAYKIIADHLKNSAEKNNNEFCLAGYPVSNTLSDYGSVSRGVCQLDQNDYLSTIVERTKIERINNEIVFTEADGKVFPISSDAMVSMNLFGFTPVFFEKMEEYFTDFLKENAFNLKSEIYLPMVVQKMKDEHVVQTKVLRTDEQWFGVTYKEDRPHVLKMINKLVADGEYPNNLWNS
ncbi:MAG: nucleotidyltransferase [Bacteroidales bacterium]|nr:nucleotidyltransferase [Bacteroidales bacterium]MCF8389474.1 nucleotidyltransferase [Bacteroidales bacterium]